jgi:hypothetical protein
MEGYSLGEVSSRAVKDQLRELIRERRKERGVTPVLVFMAIAVLVALVGAVLILG